MLSMGSVTNQSSSLSSFGQRSPVLLLSSLIGVLKTVGDDFCLSQESWFTQRLKEKLQKVQSVFPKVVDE